ncbi:MAG: tetraacyldisaccharide 4'-kinase [Deltaproteobacteria bacterium]|jgi:tetraacyldisaccharide 4'-kinase|nr:tetraacyldisaccharide 4'-kinase [Deltaproteobacteria bacterium]
MRFSFARPSLAAPKAFLKPVSSIWGWLMELRRRGYESGLLGSVKVEKPVISVGNLTLGGNCKTPMCVFLAQALTQKGLRVAILSRGYGRVNLKGHPDPLVVSKGQGPLISVRASGDEPYLMALKTQAMVILAKKRALAAKAAIKAGAEVLILDDGFQHLALKRDLDILMVQAKEKFADDLVIPAGYLRENPDAHLKADILVAIGESLNGPLVKLADDRPLFLAKMVPTSLTELNTNRPVTLAEISQKRLGAFCGLARPGSFFKSLAEMNVKVKAHLCLPDHEAYDEGTLKTLAKFKDLNRLDLLVTSAKDAVKLPNNAPFSTPLAAPNNAANHAPLAPPWPIIALESELVIDRPEEFLEKTLKSLN